MYYKRKKWKNVRPLAETQFIYDEHIYKQGELIKVEEDQRKHLLEKL